MSEDTQYWKQCALCSIEKADPLYIKWNAVRKKGKFENTPVSSSQSAPTQDAY